MGSPIAVDPDIRHAHTLPGEFYTDPARLAELRERIFVPSWQLIPDADAVRLPEQMHPFTLLPGLLDEPLLLTRDTAGEVRCLSNVCTHRGNLLATAPCQAASLRCRYHGRRFALDGRCTHMPEFEGVAGFPAATDDLPRVAHGQWGKLQFASLRPQVPLDELLAPLKARLGFLDVDALVLDAAASRDYLVQANWALYCDNFLEGFHIPFIHPALSSTLDYGAYRTELLPWGSVQIGIAAAGEPTLALRPDSPEHGQRVAAYYFWLLPNLMFNVYPWGLSANVVEPIAVDQTRVRFLTYRADPGGDLTGAGAALDRVEHEDEAVVEQVQRGVRARLYHRGRYSPSRETGVHHFHRLLEQQLELS